MNREIKFIRYHFDYDGKYLDKSEWGQFKDHFSSPVSLSNENKKLAKDCQFTGLSDKNGKEIYEEDICKQKFGNTPEIIGVVSIESTRGAVVDGKYPAWPHDIEIIGNVWENPDLLNKRL